MKALLLRRHGGLQDLELVDDHPMPRAAEGHVVIRVKASSFNYHDVFTIRGMPGIKVPLPVVLGLDMAGEITRGRRRRHRLEAGRPRPRQSPQQEEGADGRDARRRHGGILHGRRRPAGRHAGRRHLRRGRRAAGRLRHRPPHADHPRHHPQGRARPGAGRERRCRHRLRHPRQAPRRRGDRLRQQRGEDEAALRARRRPRDQLPGGRLLQVGDRALRQAAAAQLRGRRRRRHQFHRRRHLAAVAALPQARRQAARSAAPPPATIRRRTCATSGPSSSRSSAPTASTTTTSRA